MKFEEQLIQKSYYEKAFMKADETEHPVAVLGDLFFSEQKRELSDLSYIRFAQGEVYFHHRDFEAAIFKWENIQNELEPWAKKNMADAYLELELLDTAEDIYKAITTDSLILNTEVALQLFTLYIEQGKRQEADQMIKNAVILHPGYPNVTRLARAFFEEQTDWDSAVELAVNEAIRTKSPQWFNVLKSYADKGLTKSHEPAYFIPTLTVLADINLGQFEEVVSSFRISYQEENSYLNWIKEEANLILETYISGMHKWHSLSGLNKSTFLDLLGGKYRVAELEDVIPILLTSWLKIADASTAFFAAAALLAWKDVFPTSMDQSVVEEAEAILSNSHNDHDLLQMGMELLQTIKTWAQSQHIEVEKTVAWLDGVSIVSLPTSQLFKHIRNTISQLLEQQVKVERELTETIQLDEEILTKLKGSIHQLQDMEEEKSRIIQQSYDAIKEEIQADLLITIPQLIKGTAELINEDSDFRNVHLNLNEEMNARIAAYLKNTVLPIYISSLQDWLAFAEIELHHSQEQLSEWSKGFNAMLGEERIMLGCDFQILLDWQRDADRMTSSIHIETENILLRRTPSQVLLKSAGKIFGAIPKSNSVLANSYKNFIENETYNETAASISDKFFRQFGLFDKAIARDISIFLREPFQNLNKIVEEIEEEIETNKVALANMTENPEAFRDPLTLFEVRLFQYEWMDEGRQA